MSFINNRIHLRDRRNLKNERLKSFTNRNCNSFVIKDKVVSIFKTNTTKQTVYWRGKNLSKPKTQSIRYLFI